MNAILLVPPVVACIATAVALRLMLQHARLPLDRPNERSLHLTPVPRSGGLVAIPVILAVWLLLLRQAVPWPVLAACGALFLVSAADDMRGLPVGMRLAAHVAASAIVAVGLLGIDWGIVALACTTLAIGWMINLYNFMDGSDGLAGGMALIGFGAYGLAAWVSGDMLLAAAAWTISGATAAFLLYNFHPARVFLGDAGSTAFGLLAGSLGVLGWRRGLWPLWFPVLVFSPFIVDASVTLARRLLRAERIWQAHRDHYYQRLVRCGWGHKRTALAEYVLMAGCAVAALAGLGRTQFVQWGLIFACTLVYVLLMTVVDRAWRRHAKDAREDLAR